MKEIAKTAPAIPLTEDDDGFLVRRYRMLMITIGLVYPTWRFMTYYYDPNTNESWEQRGMIGVMFLSFAVLSYRFAYVRRNIATYFNIITYAWFLQTFYLMTTNDSSDGYMIMAMVVISAVGSSFLKAEAMLWYYLMCIVLTGIGVIANPTVSRINFFWGVLTALVISYVGLRSMLGLFRELRLSKSNLQKRTDEFTALSAAVQSMFLPAKDSVDNKLWHLAGFYRPVDGCGGDWWSYFENGSKLTVLTGDVTGHGPGPAMMTASIASYTRALQKERPDLSVENILHALNKYLLELQFEKSGKHNYLMTVHALEIDFAVCQIKSWSAAAPDVVILAKDGTQRFIGASGSPLGMAPDLVLGFDSGPIYSGDRILIYTDGIMEIDCKGQRISDRKVLKMAASDRAMNPKDAASSLIHRLDKMRGVGPQEDDYTLVLLDVA